MLKLYDIVNKLKPESTKVKVVYHKAYSKDVTLFDGPVSGVEDGIAFDSENKLCKAKDDEFARYEDLVVISIDVNKTFIRFGVC